MKKYENYDNTQAFDGEYEQLQAGGYICKILQVKSEDKEYGTLLRIGFDIAEGEHKDYYKRLFERKVESNPETKWPGMYYQTVKADDLKYFKGFITAIEKSNSGYKWNWDESTLKGKLFGGVFGEEEFEGNDGTIKTSVKCRFIRSVEQIRKGIDIPEIKRLPESKKPSTTLSDFDEDELPFK
jgi:hypothetical protein